MRDLETDPELPARHALHWQVTASMPQHVRVYFERELGLDPSTFDHPRETSGRKGRAPLRDKDEG